MNAELKFTIKSFKELTPLELYRALQLREDVFIIEQNCIYKDIDDYDLQAYHLLGLNNKGDLIGYSRLFPPGIKYPDSCSIGRVVVSQKERLHNYGRILMKQAIEEMRNLFPGKGITISAQLYLQKFYEEFGFIILGEVYDEDGIPHIQMVC